MVLKSKIKSEHLLSLQGKLPWRLTDDSKLLLVEEEFSSKCHRVIACVEKMFMFLLFLYKSVVPIEIMVSNVLGNRTSAVLGNSGNGQFSKHT